MQRKIKESDGKYRKAVKILKSDSKWCKVEEKAEKRQIASDKCGGK